MRGWIPAFAGMTSITTVIPAKAGIYRGIIREWIPAFAGMTNITAVIPA